MRGQFSLRTKLLAGAHEAGAEDGFPITIGNHAGSERIAFIHQPLGESEAVDFSLRHRHSKRCRQTLLHAPFLHLIIPTHLNVRLTRLGHLAHDGHRRRRLQAGQLFLLRGQFLCLGLRPGIVGRVKVLHPFLVRRGTRGRGDAEDVEHILRQRGLHRRQNTGHQMHFGLRLFEILDGQFQFIAIPQRHRLGQAHQAVGLRVRHADERQNTRAIESISHRGIENLFRVGLPHLLALGIEHLHFVTSQPLD